MTADPGTYGRDMASPDSPPRILVVDDEKPLARMVASYLERAGYATRLEHTGPDGLSAVRSWDPDVVILDLGLPGLDGMEVCRQLRTFSDAYVVMLTARDDEFDTVMGFSAGADDYVTKPFSHRELVARIRAVLRRGQDAELLPEVIEAGDVRMDVERHQVWVRGERVKLALKEFELLELLLRNAGRVMTRGQLIDRIWGADYVGDTKTLDVHVKRLRSKIEVDPAHPTQLVTVRGLGYKYED